MKYQILVYINNAVPIFFFKALYTMFVYFVLDDLNSNKHLIKEIEG